jgi:thiamine-monophosphate kinase
MARRYGEDELIARLFAPLAGAEGLGLLDDAALLAPAPQGLVATADALVAGVHFFADDPPADIARKALRVNLSDLAAKGAAPRGFLLTLALPPDWRGEKLEAFAQGLGADARAFQCPLLGGDTVATNGTLVISITALGDAPLGRFVPRSGARPGDGVFVSGAIGDAALGLALRRDPSFAARLSQDARDLLLARYLLPQPRLALGAALREFASAAMDVSDGLAGDLDKLLRASKVSARIDADAVPLSFAARAAIALDPALFETALTGGDDYEILCCAPPAREAALRAAAMAAGVVVTRIGEIVAGAPPAQIFVGDSAPLRFVKTAFQHF